MSAVHIRRLKKDNNIQQGPCVDGNKTWKEPATQRFGRKQNALNMKFYQPKNSLNSCRVGPANPSIHSVPPQIYLVGLYHFFPPPNNLLTIGIPPVSFQTKYSVINCTASPIHCRAYLGGVINCCVKPMALDSRSLASFSGYSSSR